MPTAAVLFLFHLAVSWKATKLCISAYNVIGLTQGKYHSCLSMTIITNKTRRLTVSQPAPCKQKWCWEAGIGTMATFTITKRMRRLASQLHIKKMVSASQDRCGDSIHSNKEDEMTCKWPASFT